jgi:folate-binding protein YgfZ
MSQIFIQNGVIQSSSGAAQEFRALTAGAGVYELSNQGRIVLTGTDRVRWLNGMVTNNIRDLAVGQGIYAFLLNPQGHPQADLYAYNRGESILVSVDRALVEKVLGIFDHYIIMDDVEVSDISDKVGIVGIAGPHARKLLASVGIDFSDLEPLQFSEVTWRNTRLTVTRHDNEAVESYDLQVEDPPAKADLLQSLLNAGAAKVSDQALELLRIASGIPRYDQDIRERDLPQETEQARALHFSKGCYVGQEIVERIRSRGSVHRKFTGFEVQGALPEPGTKIQFDGKDVGEITSVAAVPTPQGEQLISLGYVRREHGTAGKELTAGSARLTVVRLPFKRIFEN